MGKALGVLTLWGLIEVNSPPRGIFTHLPLRGRESEPGAQGLLLPGGHGFTQMLTLPSDGTATLGAGQAQGRHPATPEALAEPQA